MVQIMSLMLFRMASLKVGEGIPIHSFPEAFSFPGRSASKGFSKHGDGCLSS